MLDEPALMTTGGVSMDRPAALPAPAAVLTATSVIPDLPAACLIRNAAPVLDGDQNAGAGAPVT
jgi:hypothetical protein